MKGERLPLNAFSSLDNLDNTKLLINDEINYNINYYHGHFIKLAIEHSYLTIVETSFILNFLIKLMRVLANINHLNVISDKFEY